MHHLQKALMPDLADRLRRIADRLDLESDALGLALQYASSDPSGAANKAGIVVESLLKNVAKHENIKVPKRAGLGQLREALREVLHRVPHHAGARARLDELRAGSSRRGGRRRRRPSA